MQSQCEASSFIPNSLAALAQLCSAASPAGLQLTPNAFDAEADTRVTAQRRCGRQNVLSRESGIHTRIFRAPTAN